jgi:hypothetical protein
MNQIGLCSDYVWSLISNMQGIRMKLPWIENYAGTWHDEEDRTLIIKTLDDENATADLLIQGTHIIMPWCGNKPAKGMPARYRPSYGPDLNVELGRPGFSLNLNYVSGNEMTINEHERLSVGVSRYASDKDADQFGKLFGSQYIKIEAEQSTEG